MDKLNQLGLRLGVIAFIYYAIATHIRYQFFSENLPTFSLASIIIYALFIALLIYGALRTLKLNDQVAELKTLFRTMFIIVLLGELGFALISYLYVFELNPNFIDEFYARNELWMNESSKWPDERKIETLNGIKQIGNLNWKDLVQNYFTSVIKSSIIAMIIAFIITFIYKKKQLNINQ